MIVINPIALGDVACTRASPKWVYVRNGALVQVPADTLAVTYDPSDLTKAPYALVEPAARNYVINSETFSGGDWQGYLNKPACTKGYPAPDGSNNSTRLGTSDAFNGMSGLYATATESIIGVIICSIWARCVSGTMGVTFGLTDGFTSTYVLTTNWQRLVYVAPSSSQAPGNRILQILEGSFGNQEWEVWGAQVEVGSQVTSYIPTAGAPVTRAADIIAPGAGLVYSNVPIAEPAYNVGATYAKDALAYDPTTHNVFQSLIASNVGKALTDTTAWTPRGATNRWAMFDQYNQTQTSNADEIIVVVSPQTLARGGFLGNIDALDARFSVTDLNAGVVYREAQNLMQSNSKASFYRWGFERIRRRRVTSTTKLPPYASALVTIAIRKPGGTAKCGVMALGPIIDLGIAQYGLSRGIKDWSTVQFNFDGTSNTTPRGYSKTMDLDVVLDNSQIDYVIDALEDLRQKPVAWIATDIYASAGIFGTYQDFKNVVESFPQSKMSLQIQGTV